MQDASDVNIEICNELLKIIWAYDTQVDPALPVIPENILFATLRKCSIYTNLLFHLKDAFQYYKYEFGSIERSENKIIFQHEPYQYYFFRRAAKERMDNHIHENILSLINYSKNNSKVSTHTVNRGRLTFRLTGGTEKNRGKVVSAGLYMAYYLHLKQYKIKDLDNITPEDVLRFISELQNLFITVDDPAVIRTVAENQDASVVPYCINKKELAHHLHKVSGIKEKTIIKMIGHLATTLNAEMDIWRTPLISHGSDYYFNLNSISHLNTAYTADNIIQKVIDKEKHVQLFKQYLASSVLQHEKKSLPGLKERNGKGIPEDLKNTLVFELETVCLLIQPCITTVPLNSQEYAGVFDEIIEAAERLQNKEQTLREYIEGDPKKIIAVIATNYPTLSGLKVNNCFVMDHYLLINYFSTGMYKRGVSISGYNQVETKQLSSYRYYENPLEMSDNFLLFCNQPDPVKHIMNQYELKQYPISFKGSDPEILRDAIDKIPFADLIWSYVKEIENSLQQLYYFEKTLEKNPDDMEVIRRRINFILPQVLGSIAFQSEDRHARLRVLNIFKNVGYNGLAYLINAFRSALAKLSGKRFKKTTEIKSPVVDEAKAVKDLAFLLDENIKDSAGISLSELKLVHEFTNEEVINILEYLSGLLSSLDQRKYSEDEFNDIFFSIIIFTALTKDHKVYERYLYHIFTNFIDALNFNFQYQKAKNFAEEALIYSFANEPLPVLGWLCLYKCFLKQKNIYDAAFYGVLFVNCIELLPEMDEELITNALYHSMLFFRDYHLEDVEEAIFELLKTLTLSEYDRQKITLSHFSSRLLSRELERADEDLEKIREYLDRHLDAICSYHQRGALPWVSFLYNYRNIKERGYITSDIDFINKYIDRLEKEIDPDELKRIQAQFFPIPELSKEIFKDALIKIFESIDFEDAAFELQTLEPLAGNVASLSIDPLDISTLLLTGFIINDQRLTFPDAGNIAEKVPFLSRKDKKLINRMGSYDEYVFSKLKLLPGQVLLWIFDVFDKVYCLQIYPDHEITIKHLTGWSLLQMTAWLAKGGEFSFEDRGGSYSINEQEQDYIKLSHELQFALLKFDSPVKEVLLYTSLSLSSFPHNLISFIPQTIDVSFHTDAVEDNIKEHGADFLSLYSPVSNVVSLEWFLENQTPVCLPAQDFTMEAWIPIIDDDYALMLGHSLLVPLLEEKYYTPIITDLVPLRRFESTINIFMAHGGKGFEGFKTIYTRNEAGHAIIKEEGIENLFGKGVIAVVFVCHSASISPEAFAQKLVSFSHQILSYGYKAVIAPSWSFNPIIAPVWLEEFLRSMQAGEPVNKSVFNANKKVASEGFNEYHGFYAPSGWAAMHLYGNPNISFVT